MSALELRPRFENLRMGPGVYVVRGTLMSLTHVRFRGTVQVVLNDIVGPRYLMSEGVSPH